MEEKKNLMKDWRLLIGIIAVIIIIAIVIIIIGNPKFEITDFSITSDTTEYTTIANSTRYTGKGLITTQEKKGVYLVALKITLKSGGGEDSQKEEYTTIMISNGKGEFRTYEYGDEGKITKPEYEFEILGYIKF